MELNKQEFNNRAFKDLVRIKWVKKISKKDQDLWGHKFKKYKTWVTKWKKLIATAKIFHMGTWLLVTVPNAALNGSIFHVLDSPKNPSLILEIAGIAQIALKSINDS